MAACRPALLSFNVEAGTTLIPVESSHYDTPKTATALPASLSEKRPSSAPPLRLRQSQQQQQVVQQKQAPTPARRRRALRRNQEQGWHSSLAPLSADFLSSFSAAPTPARSGRRRTTATTAATSSSTATGNGGQLSPEAHAELEALLAQVAAAGNTCASGCCSLSAPPSRATSRTGSRIGAGAGATGGGSRAGSRAGSVVAGGQRRKSSSVSSVAMRSRPACTKRKSSISGGAQPTSIHRHHQQQQEPQLPQQGQPQQPQQPQRRVRVLPTLEEGTTGGQQGRASSSPPSPSPQSPAPPSSPTSSSFRDGHVDPEVAAVAVAEFGRLHLDKQVRELFRIIDLDASGDLDRREVLWSFKKNGLLRAICGSQLHLRWLLEPSAYEEILKVMDGSSSRTLNFGEFHAFISMMSSISLKASFESTSLAARRRQKQLKMQETRRKLLAAAKAASNASLATSTVRFEDRVFALIAGSKGATEVKATTVLTFASDPANVERARRAPGLTKLEPLLRKAPRVWYKAFYWSLDDAGAKVLDKTEFADVLASAIASRMPRADISREAKESHELFDKLKHDVPRDRATGTGHGQATSISKMFVVTSLEDTESIRRKHIQSLVARSEHLGMLHPTTEWRRKFYDSESKEPGKVTREEFVDFFEKTLKRFNKERRGVGSVAATLLDAEVQRLRLAFNLIDTDGSNSLSINELLAAIKNEATLHAMLAACPALKPLIAPETWFKAFMTLPTNARGEVTFSGFRHFCERANHASMRREKEKQAEKANSTGRKRSVMTFSHDRSAPIPLAVNTLT